MLKKYIYIYFTEIKKSLTTIFGRIKHRKIGIKKYFSKKIYVETNRDFNIY